METPGDGVAAAAEFAAGMEDRHHDFDRGLVLCLIQIDRDAAAVVDDADSSVGEHRDQDGVAIAGEGFIHRVVDDLVDQVVQPARAGGTDVHSWTFANRLKTFEHLDLIRTVGILGRGVRAF